MRIDIVGMPASGKSTLATAISKKLSIPHIQIDHFWFECGGKQGRLDTPNIELVKQKVREKVREAISAESWISDGVYLNVQNDIVERADVIIFLSIPLLVRLLNHGRRAFFEPKRHTHLSVWDEITFFREIVRREKKSKPKLLEFIKENEEKVLTLHSRKEIEVYLGHL
jgi:adenylate kinase family enzyme